MTEQLFGQVIWLIVIAGVIFGIARAMSNPP